MRRRRRLLDQPRSAEVMDVPGETRHHRLTTPTAIAPHAPKLPPEVPVVPAIEMHCYSCSDLRTFTDTCVGDGPYRPRTVVAELSVCEVCGKKVEMLCDVCGTPYRRPPQTYGAYNPRD